MLMEWVTKVDPQVLPVLVQVAKTKIVLLQNAQGLADLQWRGREVRDGGVRGWRWMEKMRGRGMEERRGMEG